ncbi:hypothetical protein L873DRAFT_122565 [Choiromyces venosus 120613-1]|uniref:Uncharacterized protein n=1 Tax=Choiromyces venosus 120613-1 TaxID=1336337 RepID=A0A3N4J6W2_9PEZI|nr:hypothetical protein L873DRAFT_122565 [Choiromyces venosus 120613-1]
MVHFHQPQHCHKYALGYENFMNSSLPHPPLLMRFTITITYSQQMRYIVATETPPQILGML